MNWEAVSAIGEWAGTIIVVITLVYLARQVHLSTVTNRVVGISNPDELDEIDRGRFELFMWGGASPNGEFSCSVRARDY